MRGRSLWARLFGGNPADRNGLGRFAAPSIPIATAKNPPKPAPEPAPPRPGDTKGQGSFSRRGAQ